MKEKYVKPEVKADEFAQFENVYTGGCDKNPGWINNGKNPNCHWDESFSPSMGSGFEGSFNGNPASVS